MEPIKRVIYFRHIPPPSHLKKLKQRFRLSPITVNGLSVATISPADLNLFQQCVDLGFFQIRNIKPNEHTIPNASQQKQHPHLGRW